MNTPEATEQPNPGKVPAVLGFILAFLPIQVIGITLSIVGLAKSRSHSPTRTLSIIGILLNILGAVVWGVLITIMLIAYNDTNNQAKTTEGETSSMTLRSAVLVYANSHGELPQSLSAIRNSSSQTFTFATLSTEPNSSKTVEYAICDEGQGARFGYWDYVDSKVAYKYIDLTGNDYYSDNCTAITE